MGLPVTKQWSAAGQNTRDTHAELDGTVMAVDEPFVSSSGAEMMYPGEPGAPAAEVVNCRCVLVPGMGGEEDSDDRTVNERSESEVPLITKNEDRYLPDGTGKNNPQFLRGATIYKREDGIELIYPQDIDTAAQKISPAQANRVIDRLPQSLRKELSQIAFVDYQNPMDDYWREKYKNFPGSFATGGARGIAFYANSAFDTSDQTIFETLLHEAGHTVDERYGNAGMWFSQGKEYQTAVSNDTKNGNKPYVTEYASNSITEDFAESVKLFFTEAQFENSYPSRSAIIRKVLGL